jgi:hypothetical protein
LALALLSRPTPAAAVVESPSTKWNFTLYADPQAEGSTISFGTSSEGTFKESDLRTRSFNDKLSSWSFCNGRTWPVHPAAASVNIPSAGNWEFSVYADPHCEGSWVKTWGSMASATLSAADLGTYSFTGKASAWSLCNYTSQAATVTIVMYSQPNFAGTQETRSNVSVPSGLCVTNNSTLQLNDAVSSYKVTSSFGG